MKVPISWLEKYCACDLSPEDLAQKLTMTGTAVESVDRVGNDTVLTFEITSNRADLLGVLGIAREVSALTGASLTLPDREFPVSDEEASTLTSVENKAKKLCPAYTAKVITGVSVGESPLWLQDALTAVGLRPVNNVVDITNYVMLETGQPLHAFDMDKLAEKRIVVRRARAKETIVAIDGTECALSKDDLVIADARQPVAIAGVMGGLHSEVDNSTTDILLESAVFDPFTIRQTARRLALASDSSYRFERGVTSESMMLGSDRACRLIVELAGGAAAKGTARAGAVKTRPVSVKIRWDRLNKLLGIRIPRDEALPILRNLGLTVKKDSKRQTTFTVPESRPDLTREVDLIEEVARLWGYDKIPAFSTMTIVSPEKQRDDIVLAECRRLLVGLGFYEVVTPSFVSTRDSFDLWSDTEPLALGNPVRENEPLLRKSLVGSVLQASKGNADRGNRTCTLFEIAKAYLPSNEALPRETTLLATASPAHFDELKGALESMLDSMGVPVTFAQEDRLPFAAGRSARITLLEGTVCGWIGDVSASYLRELDLKQEMCAFEVNMNEISSRAVLLKQNPSIPRFPSMSRDYAFILDEKRSWADVESCVREKGSSLVEHIAVFDVYRGEEIGTGKKSIAFSITYRAADRTLTGQDVDEVQAGIISSLTSELDATLRM
ncbi:phenylalanine--tRNA ligase subunit beta [Planctomycetota bacterium]